MAIQATADAARVTGRYELRIRADTFAIDGTSGSVRIRRGTADLPDATATIDPDAFFSLVLGQRPIGDAIASGELRLDGSPDAAERLTDLLLALVTAMPQTVNASGL